MCPVPTVGRLFMHLMHPVLVPQCSLQPFPSKMSQNPQRGNRKGNTNLLFIKHHSHQFYLPNFWWEPKREQEFHFKNNRNKTKGQVNEKMKGCKMNVSNSSGLLAVRSQNQIKFALCQKRRRERKVHPRGPGTAPRCTACLFVPFLSQS